MKIYSIFSFFILLLISGFIVAQPCGPNVSLNIQQTNVSCFGGSTGTATVSVLGGTGNYTYTWTPAVSTTQTATGLSAGTYSVTVENIGGGSGTQTVYSETFDNPNQAWTLNQSSGTNDADYNPWTIGQGEGGVLPPGCGVANNGNNTLHVTSQLSPTAGASYNAGGVCPFFCVITNMRAQSPNISTIGYTGLTLTFDYIGYGQGLLDNASLVYSTNGGTTWNLLSASLKSVLCPGGQGQWTAASYILPSPCENISNLRIGFNWTNNDDGLGTDPSFAVNNVMITTGSGGGSSCFVSANVTITQPAAALSATTQMNPAGCSGQTGSANVLPTGGTSPYTYSWNTGQTTNTILNLAAGTYTCVITDSKGCMHTASVTVTGGSALSVTSATTSVTCNGNNNGTIMLMPTTGTAPYTYSWATGQTTATITGLAPGNYSCVVLDAGGCTTTVNATITAPAALALSTTSTSVSCFGQATGNATATATGGTPQYFYSWSTGLAGATISNLAAGNYVCVVTDANNCTSTQSVTITQPAFALTGTASSTGAASNNGTATANPSGGTAPYTFSWNTTPAQTTQTATGLAAGTYTCQITDSKGCKVVVSVTVNQEISISPASLGIAEWKIFPNPAHHELSLSVSFNQKENVTAVLYDLNGKEMMQTSEKNTTEWTKQLDISSLQQGIYLLKIQTGKGYFIEKIIVE